MYLALRDGPRGFTQDFTCPGLLGIRLPNQTYFNYGTFTPCGRTFQNCSSISLIRMSPSHYPGHLAGLGYSPFARHYSGNRCYFLFLALLRCFSSRRSPPASILRSHAPTGISRPNPLPDRKRVGSSRRSDPSPQTHNRCRMTGLQPAGLPHSEIPGSKLAYSFPRLIAVRHVLRRHSVRRHPPCALCAFTFKYPCVLYSLSPRIHSI